ncbi:uncharacterized protein LOC132197550 [Neocloeon triangulifer]|uniref:uncharacterized protein LOC132197550 n=1 Tax=Neocloeon triangulifer TaxID=2078957 RepID=UPI00286EF3FD|nr:uncharacterized protein LOC132197550 [Neocloeon triangulifer]XP_059476880.1 uncharacterized protein LOC132197550 [Neocloeon triangulifer]
MALGQIEEESAEIVQQKTTRSSERNLGHFLLYSFHILCGQHLKLPPLIYKFSTTWSVLMAIHSVTITLATVYCTLSGGIALSKHLDNFGHSVYIATGFLGMIECLLRIMYTTIRKRKIESIAAKVHRALHEQELNEKNSKEFAKRLSRLISIFLIALFSAFALSIASSYMTVFGQITDLIDRFMKNGTHQEAEDADNYLTKSEVSIEILEAWYYVNGLFKIWPYVTLVKAYAAFVYATSFLALGRVVVSDILFYSWYMTVNNLYRDLVDSLPSALECTNDKKKLHKWVQHHHALNQLLKEINSLTSFAIVVAVILTGCRFCIMYFVFFKLVDATSVFLFIVYGISSIQQVFVYSILGQNIKSNVTLLHSKAYKSSWIKNDATIQHATLMICTAASDKIGQSLPGAPFFSMSLEFMASMLSVVFTYFIVLFQFQE